jgi:hypothetical protein
LADREEVCFPRIRRIPRLIPPAFVVALPRLTLRFSSHAVGVSGGSLFSAYSAYSAVNPSRLCCGFAALNSAVLLTRRGRIGPPLPQSVQAGPWDNARS